MKFKQANTNITKINRTENPETKNDKSVHTFRRNEENEITKKSKNSDYMEELETQEWRLNYTRISGVRRNRRRAAENRHYVGGERSEG